MSNIIKSVVKKFVRSEEGASGIEYALVAAMVALALVTIVPDVNKAVTKIFGDIRTTLQNPSGS